MASTIRLERIQWFDENPIMAGDTAESAYPNCDGAVSYAIEADGRIPGSMHMMQVFARGPSRGGTTGNGWRVGNVWGWDGNREAPTLTPSFLCEYPGTGIRAHLFLIAGKISLCPDSTVSLVE